MKLAKLGPRGSERPCVLFDDLAVDVSNVTEDFDEGFFADDLMEAVRTTAATLLAEGHGFAWDGMRIGAPIARPQQILCIGLNYADHARETGQAIPEEPIVFNKAPNTLVGPNDDIPIPPGSLKTDWEVELGVVIGKRSLYLANEEEALASIAGYVLVNDVSEREYQLERGGQWVKGKSSPGFNPCGPYLVTPDELGDTNALRLTLSVNGKQMQASSTSNMIFTPAYLIHHLSQFMTLEPGDLINTGTPHGVGMGLTPPQFLRSNDLVEASIEGLGSQRQVFRAG
jgi:2-keto-4-pentenoate hydratase/2-oxohepta-3-ene-1,7-dioic acid hydratase in catechol pathway